MKTGVPALDDTHGGAQISRADRRLGASQPSIDEKGIVVELLVGIGESVIFEAAFCRCVAQIRQDLRVDEVHAHAVRADETTVEMSTSIASGSALAPTSRSATKSRNTAVLNAASPPSAVWCPKSVTNLPRPRPTLPAGS